MGDVLEILKGASLDYVLRYLPLSDGYLLQAEAWLRRGLKLKDTGNGGNVSVWSLFRAKHAAHR